jgi:hypothetical protein
MAMDADQTAKVQEWMRAHPLKACPLCKASKFSVADPVGLPFLMGSNVGKALPAFPFICSGCGLTILINMSKMGM